MPYIQKAKKYSSYLLLLFLSSMLVGCGENQSIVNSIDEREANEIIVYLATQGIGAQKTRASTGTAVGGETQELWNIMVDSQDMIVAMSLLNQAGLPRRKGKTLLQLFEKQGLMTTDKEETIRYQAGIEEELTNTIRQIDGVIDANVQISFPTGPEELIPGKEKKTMKAAVYVKHQGVFDDQNNHLETKIKRLVSGSIDGLDFENVAVISDRSRYTDLSVLPDKEMIATKSSSKGYVSIWSIIMTQSSSGRFRTIFFSMIILIILFGATAGYLIYRFYPLMLRTKQQTQSPEKQPPQTPPTEE